MKRTGIIIGVLLAVGLIVLSSAAFTVRETEQVLIRQFGEVQRIVGQPGLHFKIPFIQKATYFDKRILDFDAEREEIPTLDQKQLVVDAFARYRIVDPLRFYQSVGNEAGYRDQLTQILANALRSQIGSITLSTVLTEKRADLMERIADSVDTESRNLGVEVIDVRIKRVDLPEENSQAIYRRMTTQREQEARRIRAEGDKEAQRIRADADKQRRVIIAEAQRKAEVLRGEGDAQAQNLYNAAYTQDEGFFDFWRSMQAMQKGLAPDTTTLVGPPDSAFFRYFQDQDPDEAMLDRSAN
ncbi:MAG: protease modulator HflC [Marivibrio sp.]|uniref:protease modulator HflC n=1 Tax=Marivibrio sp. TaxID=2039719 RepID=UPI0032EC49EE